ncbi:MAG: PDZ domain-containing protein [Campylobacterota bacterium]|nr:PDZ domain-containing protein [Campylobacterota bacterium]
MKHLFKPEVIKWLWTVLLVWFVIKVLWFLVEVLWLPTKGMTHIEEKGGKALYYRVKLSQSKAPAPVIKKQVPQTTAKIKDIKLLAIYHALDVTVITVEYKGKTKVLGRGDEINGFILESAGHNYALFRKNDKKYKVSLIISTKGSSSIKSSKPSFEPTPQEELEGEIVDAGDHKIIDKSLISHYAKNMDDIYKNIGIKQIKKGKNLKGFSISFIRKGSPFEKLGLKRGDVIQTVNGQKIDSEKAAFDIYKDIGNIENLTLVIQRGKEEMELEYEVN